ncbi:MAG: hypothetical protein MJ108_08705 [Saccharofermentans sp.]|nr:hypothetical protein [Saccharofermentans sp.]
MKKLLSILASLAVISSMSYSSLAYTPTMDSINPRTGKESNVEINNENPQINSQGYGRLVISSANIDVALYNSISQSVCDAEDSACFYHMPNIQGMTIADHNYQAFSSLTQVNVGDIGMIKTNNGGTIYIKCVEVADGHNTIDSLVYEDGTVATGRCDYLTYTCLENYKNIRICQWNIISADNIDNGYESQFDIDSRTLSRTEDSSVQITKVDPLMVVKALGMTFA